MPEIPSKISDEMITSEADMICPAEHRKDPPDNGPCRGCRDHVTTMLNVALEMYEGGWDPEDARHQGFADGWLNAWPVAYRAGREDEARSQAADALDVVMSDGDPAEHNPDWRIGYDRGFVVGKRAGEDEARNAGLTCQQNGDGLWPPADHFHECLRERGHRSRTHRCRCDMEWQLVDQPAVGEDQDTPDPLKIGDPPTFTDQPVPGRPGVVRPVLNKPIYLDPETGAFSWDQDTSELLDIAQWIEDDAADADEAVREYAASVAARIRERQKGG